MKKFLILIPFLLNANLLSDLKQKELQIDKEKAINNSLKTKKSWINPIMVTFAISKDKNNVTTNSFIISVNQPIFKSGAIFYSIKYANKLKELSLDKISLQQKNLIKTVYNLVFDYNILKIQKKILEKKIENAKIDVERKKEDYLNGISNSSLLDNAILKLNALKVSLLDLDSKIINIKNNFSKLSNLNIEKVDLPQFKLISKKEYLKNNLALLIQKKESETKKYLHRMNIGNNLLTVSLNAKYNYQKIKDKRTITNDIYNVGISASLPLNINTIANIEDTKLSYLKSHYLIKDKEKELSIKYKNTVFEIENLKKKIALYKENIKLYDNLISSTFESIKAGNATKLDLEVLTNSKIADSLNIKILNLQIQKKLLDLYYDLTKKDLR